MEETSMVGKQAEEEKMWPPWLYPLLHTTFFVPCKFHGGSNKAECNMYCLDCTNGALCSTCLDYHRDHRAIQIRRSSYHDVIRVSEIQKYLDISGVQTYIINGARVVFLNERPQPRPAKGVSNTCDNCKRSLIDTFAFCSLGCKLARSTKGMGNWHEKPHESPDESSYEKDGVAKTRIWKQPEKQSDGKYQDDICISPPTPPPTVVNNRMTKRRKGTPHRSPMGVC